MKFKISAVIIAAAVVVLAAVLLIPEKSDGADETVSQTTETSAQTYEAVEKEFVHGTAETPDGRTVIVSIFGNDPNYSWNFDSETDRETAANINNYMGVAADFIENTVSEYGRSAEFISDFQKNDDLFYSADFGEDMTDWELTDWNVWNFIDDNIDTDAIMEKYDADNIIFFFILNTDVNSEGVTCTRNWYEGMERPYEIVYLYNIDRGYINGPAVYAHEILHTFGAIDLYDVNEETGIDSYALDYIAEYMPNEIMYTCSDIGGGYLYDRITNEVSSLTAYYIGLTDSSDAVSELGLCESEHLSE